MMFIIYICLLDAFWDPLGSVLSWSVVSSYAPFIFMSGMIGGENTVPKRLSQVAQDVRDLKEEAEKKGSPGRLECFGLACSLRKASNVLSESYCQNGSSSLGTCTLKNLKCIFAFAT